MIFDCMVSFKEFLIITTPLAYLNGLAFYIVHYIIYLVYGSVIIFLMITYQCLGVVPIIHGVIIYVLYLTAMMSYSYLLSVCFQKGCYNYDILSYLLLCSCNIAIYSIAFNKNKFFCLFFYSILCQGFWCPSALYAFDDLRHAAIEFISYRSVFILFGYIWRSLGFDTNNQ